MTISFALSGPPISGALIGLFSAFIISINYDAPWTKRIVSSISITAIGLTIYYTIALAIGIELPSAAFVRFTAYRSTDTLFLMEMVLFPVFALVVALLLQNFRSIRKNVIVLPVFWVSIFIIPLSSIIILFIIIYATDLSLVIKTAVLFILVGINVLVFYLHDTLSSAYESRLNLALRAQERRYYFEQCQMMQESVEQTRSVRHDMVNHFVTMRGIAVKNGDNEIVDYLDKMLADANKAKTYSNTGNVVFDSIINFKFRNAEQKNIKPNIRLQIPPTLNAEASDVVSILGNLLENALDAMEFVQEKTIRLEVVYDRETLLIVIENPFDGVIKYVTEESDDGDEEVIITRKEVGDHGYGLRNVHRALEKYNGSMDIEIKENIFSVTVFLYVGQAPPIT
ncbi:MAG: ATP-binding protein [Treponema sp.]|nr:ATP-binding protein [Treponema sp.]